MASRRSYAAAVAAGGQLVVLGGWDGDGERRLESAEALPVRGGAAVGPWRRLPSMSRPRYGLAAAAVDAAAAAGDAEGRVGRGDGRSPRDSDPAAAAAAAAASVEGRQV